MLSHWIRPAVQERLASISLAIHFLDEFVSKFENALLTGPNDADLLKRNLAYISGPRRRGLLCL